MSEHSDEPTLEVAEAEVDYVARVVVARFASFFYLMIFMVVTQMYEGIFSVLGMQATCINLLVICLLLAAIVLTQCMKTLGPTLAVVAMFLPLVKVLIYDEYVSFVLGGMLLVWVQHRGRTAIRAIVTHNSSVLN